MSPNQLVRSGETALQYTDFGVHNQRRQPGKGERNQQSESRCGQKVVVV